MGMTLALMGNAGGKTQQFLLLLVKIKSLDASVSNKKPSLFFFFSAPQVVGKHPSLCLQDRRRGD